MTMTDVDRLLREYVREHRAGESPDPEPFLEQLEGRDRERLAALIQGYWETAPRRDWDPEAFKGSVAERVTSQLATEWSVRADDWQQALPTLRHRAKLKRDELVRELAGLLGVAGKEERVALRYHEMETGRLEPAGVSSKVLDALGGLLGVSTAWLRRVGEGLEEHGAGSGPATMYTRTAQPEEGYADLAAERELPAAPASPGEASPGEGSEAEWDEVDRLFRGGD